MKRRAGGRTQAARGRTPPVKAVAGRRRRPGAGGDSAAGTQRAPGAVPVDVKQIEAIRKQLESATAAGPPRWNANPEEVRRAVLKLVLTLVELIRQLLERQAIRRMDAGTLTARETEDVGLALMRLQETIVDLAKQFDIDPCELNLDLGPIGRLL